VTNPIKNVESVTTDWINRLDDVRWNNLNVSDLIASIPKEASNSWSFELPSSSGPITLTVKGQDLAIKLTPEALLLIIIFGNYSQIYEASTGTVHSLSLAKDGAKIAPTLFLKDVPFGTSATDNEALLKVFIEDLTDADEAVGESTISFLIDHLDTDVRSSRTTRLTDAKFNLYLDGLSPINGNGNQYDNIINGNSKANTLRGYTGDDTLNGLGGRDTIFGHGGDDILNGGGANDILNGGLGQDTMNGGPGRDTYVYKRTNDSRVDREDIILHFNGSRGDRIDLSAVDANRATAGKQQFKWIGKREFSGAPGEVRFENGFLEMNTNSNLNPEMAIILDGVNSFNRDYIIFGNN